MYFSITQENDLVIKSLNILKDAKLRKKGGDKSIGNSLQISDVTGIKNQSEHIFGQAHLQKMKNKIKQDTFELNGPSTLPPLNKSTPHRNTPNSRSISVLPKKLNRDLQFSPFRSVSSHKKLLNSPNVPQTVI